MSVPNDARLSHELSVPGGRPFCGAEAVSDPPPDPARPVTCPACARLIEDEARRSAHEQRPRSDESED